MSEVSTEDETGPATDTEAGETPACLCQVSNVLDLLSKKYAIQVVCAVGVLEPVRYRRLADQLGDVSSSTLSTRLEQLADADILEREQYDEIPPRVEYRLTEDGRELSEHLQPVVEWAQQR